MSEYLIRRPWTAVALLSVLTGCGPGPAMGSDSGVPPSSGSLLALTYNVAGLPEGLSGSMPEMYMPLISPLLNGYEMVLVQEDFAYHDELIADVVHPYLSVPGLPTLRPAADGLNRFSETPFEPVERVTWEMCNGFTDAASDCLASKGFSLGVTTLGPGVTVDVYNLHAEAGGSAEDIAARTDGFLQLTAFIEERSVGRPLIVAGDFNLHGFDPDDEPLLEDLMQTLGLSDACRTLSCGDDHIDRFLFRSSDLLTITPVSWAVATEFVDAMGNDLSDHEAITTTFDWDFAGE